MGFEGGYVWRALEARCQSWCVMGAYTSAWLAVRVIARMTVGLGERALDPEILAHFITQAGCPRVIQIQYAFASKGVLRPEWPPNAMPARGSSCST